MSPKSVREGKHNYGNFYAGAQSYRFWYLESVLSESEATGLNVPDEKGRPISPKDSIFRGLIYACKDFNVRSPDHSFVLEGGLIAYGDENGGGNIRIDAADCRFSYDDQYLFMLGGSSETARVLYWTSY